MIQIARVKKKLENGMAEVAVERQSACAHDCSKCAGCDKMVEYGDVVVKAKNELNADTGDVVLVESGAKELLAAAAMIYILPFLLFFVFYFVIGGLGMAEGAKIGGAFVGFLIGILLAVRWDRLERKRKALQFHIVEIKKRCSDM